MEYGKMHLSIRAATDGHRLVMFYGAWLLLGCWHGCNQSHHCRLFDISRQGCISVLRHLWWRRHMGNGCRQAEQINVSTIAKPETVHIMLEPVWLLPQATWRAVIVNQQKANRFRLISGPGLQQGSAMSCLIST